MARDKRIAKGRKMNPTLFVFCEGKTEESYINFLKSAYRLPSLIIHSKVAGSQITDKFIRLYKKDKPTHAKDHTLLVYDSDVEAVKNKSVQLTEGKALFSNPSIELWFLLHCKNQTTFVSAEDCCKELTNRCKDYKKGRLNDKLKEKLTDKRKEACQRAEKLKPEQNPSTDLYQLIELLETLKK